MMIAEFGLVAIKHLCGTHMLSKFSSIKVETRLMKHDPPTNFAHAETICQEVRTQVPARRKRLHHL
jgi:hypothetical protein